MNMSKQIFIIRTAPYDYQLEGMNLYQSFNAVAKREIEVSVKPAAGDYFKEILPTEIFNANSTYCSPRKRSIQTASFISPNPEILEELIEVRFKMEDFIVEEDFFGKLGNPNIRKARKTFVEALVSSRLEESYPEVLQRIESLLKIILQGKSGKIVVFSHGFFMKIVEAYIRDKSIKNYPKDLLKYFDGDSEAFKFCEGFILELENEEFKFNSYVRNIGGK